MALVSPALVDLTGPRQFRYLPVALSGHARAGFIISTGMGFATNQLVGTGNFPPRHPLPGGAELLPD